MAKNLYVGQTFNECRAALVDSGEVIDFFIERVTEKSDNHPLFGNIYKGRVLKVLPGIQSAFVDIGHEKAAFLCVDEAYIPTQEEQREMRREYDSKSDSGRKLIGEIIPDELSTLTETLDTHFLPKEPIQYLLNEGDEILVQVAKEPISTKGARITKNISLAGRYVVFMPLVEHIGVSQRIASNDERNRLKEIMENVCPQGKGVIARTAAEGRSSKILKADFNMLVKIWRETQEEHKKAKAPGLCYKDLHFVQRVLRDATDEDEENIYTDSRKIQKEIEKFTVKFMPALKGKCRFYDESVPLFEKYGIDMEIERALSNKAWLRSGGAINIDQTEALVSIDVNTGKFVGKKNLEDTILRTNLEAVKEVAHQLRLRNCGGIIIIDFIDMEREEHREQVYQALLEALKRDRAKTSVMPISGLGLVEMTRKRTRDTLTRVMCEPCPYCEGTGRVKSTESVCYQLVREVIKVLRKNKDCKKVYIFAHPEVVASLCDDEHGMIESLEEAHGKVLAVRSENNYHIEQYEVFPQ